MIMYLIISLLTLSTSSVIMPAGGVPIPTAEEVPTAIIVRESTSIDAATLYRVDKKFDFQRFKSFITTITAAYGESLKSSLVFFNTSMGVECYPFQTITHPFFPALAPETHIRSVNLVVSYWNDTKKEQLENCINGLD